MAHPNQTIAAKKDLPKPRVKLKAGDNVRWAYSQYIGAVTREYCGVGTVEGTCQVIASAGLRVMVTDSDTHAKGSRVEVYAHRCEPWPVDTPWRAETADETPVFVGDCPPLQRETPLENESKIEIQSPNPNPEEARQSALF